MKEVSNFRISGHETFALRYAWLPKVVKALDEDPKLFQNEDSAMVTLGVGKNMVCAIKFWGECFGVINQDSASKDYRVTSFGKKILGVGGYDPYLEHPATLWLLHWQLCHSSPSLLAWDFLFNHWPYQELKTDRLVSEIKRYPSYGVEATSANTLESHIDVFFHTYAQRRERKNMSREETLDSPLTELGLIRRYSGDDRTRDTYTFPLEARPELPIKLFCWAVLQFIERKGEGSISSFQELVTGNNSPGRIFRLTEQSVRERMIHLEVFNKGILKSEETASTHVIIRKSSKSATEFLKDIF
jgi:hypothetical protein